jgi:sulfur-carrier protein adenylyltransferase/sulfurtransferase
VPGEISVLQLKARRDAGEHPLVIDVREAWELDVARLEEVLHIPMNEIAQRLSELDRERETIVMCRSGGRSLRVAQYLEQQGLPHVLNLTGGILAWAQDVDPSVPTY